MPRSPTPAQLPIGPSGNVASGKRTPAKVGDGDGVMLGVGDAHALIRTRRLNDEPALIR
jgi:hypothetical protein